MIDMVQRPAPNFKPKFEVTADLIGKYINQVLWSDVNPVGKIVGIKGKTKVLIQPIVSSENKSIKDMTFIPGGFVGTFTDQHLQSYDFFEVGEVFEANLSNTSMKKRFWSIEERPRKFYDYNF